MIDEGRRMSFEERADEYRLARPPYPERLYEILTHRCGLGPGKRVLEVGPGTGQATSELLARGASVVAVEPGVRLAAHLAADLAGDALQIVNESIEAAPLPNAGFDIVASATAFHWVRPGIALPRLARALRDHGWLAVWWTAFGDPTRPTPFRSALLRLYERNFPQEPRDPPRGPLNIDSWCDELSQGGYFARPEVAQIRWEHPLTPDGARRLFGSFPNVNELDPQRRTAHLDAIADLVQEAGGLVLDPYVTVLYLSQVARSG
jgi:SAM-dependent methyltransferase